MPETTQPVVPDQSTPSERQLIAPLWHTAVLVLLILSLSATSYLLTRRLVSRGAVPGGARLISYLVTLLWEWGLVLYVSLATRRRGMTMRKLINARWATARAVWRDIGIVLLVLLGFFAIEVLGSLIFHEQMAKASRVLRELTPHTALELVVWVLLSVSAGFCEEFVFRGYLQQQFGRLTGNTAAAIVLQALLFGAGHGYQGWALMLIIVFIGALFGIVAAWRNSLAPTMITHGLADTIGGVGAFLSHVLHRI